ncbi:MAG: hypothetical protein SFV54_19240 [Bryobacteraceae bacterium]|nr:hypothetical protein [Bryobacteraceae bacterium]
MWPRIAKIALLQTDEPQGDAYRQAFDSIAFNNYVHAPMERAAVPPSAEHIKVAQEVYLNELAELKPHLSLVLAKRVYLNLPNQGTKGTDVEFDGKVRSMWVYDLGGHRTLVGWLKHPASGHWVHGWRDEIEVGFARKYVEIARGELSR